MVDQALEIFSCSYYRPELARTTFKKSQLLHIMGEEEEAALALNRATELRRTLVPGDERSCSELRDEDFDTLVIFWSR